jgi:hypothetical protein
MAATPNLKRSAGNLISTTLSSGISDSDLSITVSDGSSLDTTGGYIIIDEAVSSKREVVYYESRSGNVLTVSIDGRGREGTTPVSHDSGATVSDVLVKSHLNDFIDRFEIGHTDAGAHELPNNTGVSGLETGGTSRNLLKMNSSDIIELGDSNNELVIPAMDWQSFTPTWNNVTVGNGTSEGFYTRINDTIIGTAYFALGSTSSITGTVSLTPPVGTPLTREGFNIGSTRSVDFGTGAFSGLAILASNTIRPRCAGASASFVGDNEINATTPFTWTTNDYFHVNFTYHI